ELRQPSSVTSLFRAGARWNGCVLEPGLHGALECLHLPAKPSRSAATVFACVRALKVFSNHSVGWLTRTGRPRNSLSLASLAADVASGAMAANEAPLWARMRSTGEFDGV